jgi:tRNA dimethylallyltransferase
MLYVIAGATASGKTPTAIALAKLVNGEVINADSMQVYRGMDIGTAKPTQEERDGVPHHLLDIVNPDEPFSAARYQALAKAAVADIQARGRTPILAGGTGFYINAVVYDTDFSQGENNDTALRNHYTNIAAEKSPEFLHKFLQERDPHAAAAIHSRNVKRVARALAFCESTGNSFSEHNATQREKRQAFPLDISFTVLDMPRELLYERINRRTRFMLAAGLEDEVKNLLEVGYSPDLPAMRGIGYKEVLAGFTGDTLAEKISQATRNYAKRQLTWFRNNAPHARWLDASHGDAEKTAKEILI